MIFPNLYRNSHSDVLASLGRRSVSATGSATAPSSRAATDNRQATSSPQNLGVTLGRGEYTTAVMVVFALGIFLFLCGVCMILGGLSDNSRSLLGLGVASIIGGILMAFMGWSLCLKVKQKRNQQEGSVHYTAVGPTDQGERPPPAYTLIDNNPSSPGYVSTGDVHSTAHTTLVMSPNSPNLTSSAEVSSPHSEGGTSFAAKGSASPGSVVPTGLTFPFLPPSYEESLPNR